MSTMLLESALADQLSSSSSSDDVSQPPAPHLLRGRSHRHGYSYTDSVGTAGGRTADRRKPVSGLGGHIPISSADSFPPIPPNAGDRMSLPINHLHPNNAGPHVPLLRDRQSLDHSPRHSAVRHRRESPLSDGSPPISASRRPYEESSSAEMASSTSRRDNLDGMTRRLSTYEKQISIDPHSVSYRALGSLTGPFGWESELPAGRCNSGESTSDLPLQPPTPAALARLSTSDASTAPPHSPRSINFPGNRRSYLRGRLSIPDLSQGSPSAETLNSDYSSDRSSEYSIADSPVSTLDLHRSPLHVAPPPPPPPEYYYNSVYVPPPPPPPPRYSTLTAGTRSTARQNMFSAPLPQPQRMGSYKKTVSFQVRKVDDFTNGRQERSNGGRTRGSGIVDRRASLRQDANARPEATYYAQPASQGMSNMERHASLRLNAYMQANQGRAASMERAASSRLDAYIQFPSGRGLSMEPRRNHSVREIIENPRSSSAEMSCCSFNIPFLGGPKARLRKQPPELQVSSPVTSKRVNYDNKKGLIPPRTTYNGHVKQGVINEEIISLNNASPETAIFREPSVMERFEYRKSKSTGELYMDDEEEDVVDDEDAEPDKMDTRAQEVLLSFNEAYSPVASAFVFHPNESTKTTSEVGLLPNIAPRKALKGSNPASPGTRPTFRRVRFNLDSTDAMGMEQEAESEVSSLTSMNNSREMPTMMGTMGPSFLPRSTSRRGWDELLNTANKEVSHEHQTDLFLRLVNGAKSFKESTPYKPMLFRPDTN